MQFWEWARTRSTKFPLRSMGVLTCAALLPLLIQIKFTDIAHAAPTSDTSPWGNPLSGNTTSAATAQPASVEPEDITISQDFPRLDANYQDAFTISAPANLSGRIAFSVIMNGLSRILVLDLDAHKVRKLIEGPGNNSYPTWSNDGKKIAFVSDRDGNQEIYSADWLGKEVTRLTNNQVLDDNPSWAPDGKRITFYENTPRQGAEDDSNIFTVLADGTEQTRVTNFSGRNTNPHWSPDGESVSYSTNRFWPGWDVCIWNLSQQREHCALAGKISFCRSDWGPDGKELAYSVEAGSRIDIGLYTFESQHQDPLTQMEGKAYDAEFSPDGKLIAFVAEEGVNGRFSVFAVNREKKVIPLLRSNYSLRYVSWSAVRTIDLEAERMAKSQNDPTPGAKPDAASKLTVPAKPATSRPNI